MGTIESLTSILCATLLAAGNDLEELRIGCRASHARRSLHGGSVIPEVAEASPVANMREYSQVLDRWNTLQEEYFKKHGKLHAYSVIYSYGFFWELGKDTLNVR